MQLIQVRCSFAKNVGTRGFLAGEVGQRKPCPVVLAKLQAVSAKPMGRDARRNILGSKAGVSQTHTPPSEASLCDRREGFETNSGLVIPGRERGRHPNDVPRSGTSRVLGFKPPK